MSTPSRRSYWLTVLLIISLFSSGLLPGLANAQDRRRKPVVVSFGQPNIWSLEQAHYLLARMHMTNVDLQAKTLSDAELDPNRIDGTRITILKQLLEIGAQFDQGIGFQNQRIVETARFNDDRRRNLITNRDSLRTDSLRIQREKNELTSERESITDPNSERAKQLDAQIKQKTSDQAAIDKEVTFHDGEIQKLGAEPSGTPGAPSPSASPFDKTRLPDSILSKLGDDELKKLFGANKEPKLNATTMLDNTVQLQYEIIAKQLTLLRDEVGPGERLVFLELPQSVYTTPGSGDEKMAQAWWHVNGYTRTDPLVRLLLELYEVELKWAKIQEVTAYKRYAGVLGTVKCPAKIDNFQEDLRDDHLFEIFLGLHCERQSARNAVLDKLYREANSLFSRVEQNGARNTSEMVEAVRRLVEVTQQKREIGDDGPSLNSEMSVRTMGKEALTSTASSTQNERTRRQDIEKLKDDLLRILSDEKPFSSADTEALGRLKSLGMDEGSQFERGIEFIRLDDELVRNTNDKDIKRRTVRTVDIIPRQSSLNVNDIQSTVKATGVLAAFKFLFGFAGQVNFQRQKEQFEQFIHQELYASGFGKGNRDFGWTFGALPGTNRVAPGVRTTYAALVVPEEAESIILSARGCYFPRKSYQPLDFEDTGHADWRVEDKFRSYNCGDDQTYIVPIPDGGKASNFWVTNVDYEDGKNGGEFVTVSVRGNNFSSQMGVLINGLPLAAAVGLAQPHLMPKRPGANNTMVLQAANNCVADSTICGSYERIDSEQIIFSFRMPANYTGTPTITLIGPGKSIDLNSLRNMRINRKSNLSLNDGAPFMYGRRPGATLIDLQLLNFSPGSARVKALLTGSGFEATDVLYVNGTEILVPYKDLKSPNLYRLEFDLPPDDQVKITLVRDKEVISKSIPNPAALKINTATVASYEPPANNKSGVLIVKLDGAGFTPNLSHGVDGAAQSRFVYVSPVQVMVRIIDPKAPLVITLTNNATRGSANTVIESLPAARPSPSPPQ